MELLQNFMSERMNEVCGTSHSHIVFTSGLGLLPRQSDSGPHSQNGGKTPSSRMLQFCIASWEKHKYWSKTDVGLIWVYY